MRQLLEKASAVMFLTLLSLWLVGLFVAPEPAAQLASAGFGFGREDGSRQQVANNLRALKLEKLEVPLLLDRPDAEGIRVYEKSAQLASSTAAFDDDQESARQAIAGHGGLVLNERSSGIGGQRRLTLQVSVQPERFEGLTARLREIGRLESVSVQQRDRTEEFRRLRGQQQWLKQQRDAVAKLKADKGSVEDQLRILQKLHEIEKELQAVAGLAGDLLGKESQ
jgi:hypothetical protein